MSDRNALQESPRAIIRRALAVLVVVLVIPLAAAKCSQGSFGRSGREFPTKSVGDWQQIGQGQDIRIGLYPGVVSGPWVQIGWTRGGRRVWGLLRDDGPFRPQGSSGP